MSDTEPQQQQQAAPPVQEWPFAAAYKDRYGALPGSQQREAVKRLCMRARNPLTSDKLTEESPDVEACLSALYTAYTSKKERARLASAAKRATEKEAKKAAAAAVPEPGPQAAALAQAAAAIVEAEPGAPADLTLAAMSLEPASVCCEEVQRLHAVKAVAPVQVPVVLPPASQPIPVPVPAAKPVAQKTVPVARGLGAMLKRS